jgi:hypothetical protein
MSVFDEGPDRGPPTSLRGWLSDVYMPCLLDADEQSLDALVRRLGGRATIDDPIFGRASGLPTLERYIAEMSKWLKGHGASYERVHFTTGTDRDVTEGMLTLRLDSKTVELPIAVVAERRRSREIELRLYYSTQPIKGTSASRSPMIAEAPDLTLPDAVEAHVAGLGRGDLNAVLASFEADGAMQEARGVTHAKSGDLKEFYGKLFEGSGVELVKGAAADDGRTLALEYTLVRIHGKPVPPQAGLAIYVRGDNGLIRTLRVYDDLES